MLKLYTVTFTQDREHYQTINVPANNVADVYIEVQKNFIGAEITNLKLSGKVISISSEGWLNTFARYLVRHARINDFTDVMNGLESDTQRDELIEAIWKIYHK